MADRYSRLCGQEKIERIKIIGMREHFGLSWSAVSIVLWLDEKDLSTKILAIKLVRIVRSIGLHATLICLCVKRARDSEV